MSETATPHDRLGIIYDLPFAEYRAREGINSSIIVDGKKSMLHMHAAATERGDSSKAQELGTLAHYRVLENGDKFTISDLNKNKDAYKAIVAAANQPWRVISTKTHDTINRMREAVYANSDAVSLLTRTRHEGSMFWGGKYGRAKGRMDGFSDGILFDYKTAGDGSPRGFFRNAENLSYPMKMAWYVEGLTALGYAIPDIYIIVQESKPPFDVWVCKMPYGQIVKDREEAVAIALEYRISLNCNSFQGLGANGMIEYERPAWAMPDEVDLSDGETTADEL